MEKLTGKKIDTAIFISGSGSNLNSIIKNSLKKNFPIKISLVISNNKNAYGINYAKNNKIKFKIINSKKMINFESKTLIILKKNNIKLICLAGFMKVLSDKFIKDFKYKILNIHPSLLPKYKGLNTHKRVLKNNEKFSGCTVHYVTNKLDSGRVILQKKVRIIKADNEKTLRKKILKIEHLLYPKAIKLALKN
jgi:formyltetrahydrofolate-dependent phosphoribosylglycinamide formyltransferase